jgi:hypothetical protein
VKYRIYKFTVNYEFELVTKLQFVTIIQYSTHSSLFSQLHPHHSYGNGFLWQMFPFIWVPELLPWLRFSNLSANSLKITFQRRLSPDLNSSCHSRRWYLFTNFAKSCPKSKLKPKLFTTDGRSVSQSVCLGVRHPFGTHDQILLVPFFCRKIALLFVLWRPFLSEVGSVICSAYIHCVIWNYWVPFPSPLTIRRDYGGSILTRLHTGVNPLQRILRVITSRRARARTHARAIIYHTHTHHLWSKGIECRWFDYFTSRMMLADFAQNHYGQRGQRLYNGFHCKCLPSVLFNSETDVNKLWLCFLLLKAIISFEHKMPGYRLLQKWKTLKVEILNTHL